VRDVEAVYSFHILTVMLVVQLAELSLSYNIIIFDYNNSKQP